MRRKATKKESKKTKLTKPKKLAKLVEPKPIGVATHYYTGIKVGIFKFKKPVRAGAKLRALGATTNFTFKASSMQFNHKAVKVAPKGKQIGIKVPKRVRVGDEVFEVL